MYAHVTIIIPQAVNAPSPRKAFLCPFAVAVCVCGKNTNINSTLAKIFKVHETLLLTLGTRLQADLGNTLYRVPINILSPPQPRILDILRSSQENRSFSSRGLCFLPRGQVAMCSEEVETATSPNRLSCPSVPHGHTGCSVSGRTGRDS